ncbi:hypothetical protein Tco_1126126 [Tanacetum coccineum]
MQIHQNLDIAKSGISGIVPQQLKVDTYNEPLGRGTEIRFHLKEETGEYLEESKPKACKLVDVEMSADEDDFTHKEEKGMS